MDSRLRGNDGWLRAVAYKGVDSQAPFRWIFRQQFRRVDLAGVEDGRVVEDGAIPFRRRRSRFSK
jgi:hypothetical protein